MKAKKIKEEELTDQQSNFNQNINELIMKFYRLIEKEGNNEFEIDNLVQFLSHEEQIIDYCLENIAQIKAKTAKTTNLQKWLISNERQ